MKLSTIFLLAISFSLGACNDTDKATLPPPSEFTSDDMGQICGMLLSDHPGPKGQIYLIDQKQPLWFATVRETIAYVRMGDGANAIRVIYVNDMGKAQSWAVPGPGTWINADKAVFVINSEQTGGMGAPAVVPFGEAKAAEHFVSSYGGDVVHLADIPNDYVFGSPSREIVPPLSSNDPVFTNKGNHQRSFDHATQ
jgi:copper chaperone NosL